MTKEPTDQTLYEALGLTKEKAEQICEVVEEQLRFDTDLASKINFLRYTGWTPEEDAFALFVFGYGIREIELMNETLGVIEILMPGVTEMVNNDGK